MKLDDFLNQLVRLSLEAESAELRTRATEFYVELHDVFLEDEQTLMKFLKLFD